MRNWAVIALLIFLYCTNGLAQNTSNSKAITKKDKDVMLQDVFKGNIPANGYADSTTLLLQHQRFHDMGAYTLTQKSKNATIENKGGWTVLKGSAKDDNATVVELDAPGKTLYFLRLKSGSLQ